MENSVQLLYAGRSPDNVNSSITATTSSTAARRRMSAAAGGGGDTEARARALAERMGEVSRILANEPSLALYRIEEHVRKTVPRLAAQRAEVARLDRDIAGHVTDVDCVLATLRSMGRGRASLQAIGEMARNALFVKQQLDYERRRRTVASVLTEATAAISTGANTAAAAAGAGPATAASSPSVLESARTFLRAKTLDYSQNLIRRAQAAKSVEIADFQAPPPPMPMPAPPPPHAPPPRPLTQPPQRSTSAQLLLQLPQLKPVSECDGDDAAAPPTPPPPQPPLPVPSAPAEAAVEESPEQLEPESDATQ